MDICEIRKHQLHFTVLADRHSQFWTDLESGQWEPDTFRVLDRFLSSDTHFIDIGAWIGPTVLYGAQIAKSTLALEPDPVAFKELEANMNANSNAKWHSRLSIARKALNAQGGTVTLGSKGQGGDSESSSFHASEQLSWQAEAITFEEILDNLSPDFEELFIKMDIEGGEYELLPSIRANIDNIDCSIYLSIHSKLLADYLEKDIREGITAPTRRWFYFLYYHFRLVRSIPLRHLYHSNGKQVRLWKEFAKLICLGRFAGEIVCSNRKW